MPKVESAKTGWLCNRQNSASEAGMDRSAASSGNVVRLGWPFSLFRLVIYNWSNIVLNVLGEVKSGFLFCCERLSKPTGKGGQKHVERGTHPQNASTSSKCIYKLKMWRRAGSGSTSETCPSVLLSEPVLFLLAPVEDLKRLLRAGSSPGRKASRKGSLMLRTSQISRFSPLV